MKLYPVFIAGFCALASALTSLAQSSPPRLNEPHDDAIVPDFLSEHTINGFAVVEALVGPDGRLISGHVIALSHPDLAKYAVDDAKKWRYTPAMVNGKPVPAILDLPVWYNSNLTVTDDVLAPLVQVCGYINRNWARLHGYNTLAEIYGIQSKGKLAAIPLVQPPGTLHLVADPQRTPKDMKEAADFIDKNVGGADFPARSLEILHHIDAFGVILPALSQNPAATP